MGPPPQYSDYDAFAWAYNKHWGSAFTESILPVIDKLVLQTIPPKARILDVCCGTGQLASALVKRGYRVTGVDGSKEMIRIARRNAPKATFHVEDARSFRIAPPCDAALSTYDSLNHMMALEDLTAVFRNVHDSLRDGGWFLFDLNMEEGYTARWRGESAIVEDDHVVAYRSSYSPDDKVGRMEFTIFRKVARGWKRTDLALTQRCYSDIEVRSALKRAGFEAARVFDGARDLEPFRNVGRWFFLCRRPVAAGGRR